MDGTDFRGALPSPATVERVDLDGLRLERLTLGTRPPDREASALRTGPIAIEGPPATGAPNWLPRFVAALVLLDALAFLLGGLFGRLLRFADLTGEVYGVSYLVVLVAATP